MGRTKRKIDVIGRDLSDREIIRGYVENPERAQFTALMIANTTLVSLDMVQHELTRLERMGVVRSGRRIGRQRVWQKAEETRTKPAKQAKTGMGEKGTSETHVPTEAGQAGTHAPTDGPMSNELQILGVMEAGIIYRRADLSRLVGRTVQKSHLRYLLAAGLIHEVPYKTETRFARNA